MFGSKRAKSRASLKRIAWIVGGKCRFWRLNAGFWCIYGETCYNRGRAAPSAAVFDRIQCFGGRVEQCSPSGYLNSRRAKARHQTNLNRRFIIAQEREARINGEIHAKEVRLISGTGEQLGIVTVKEALAMAEERDVDLVEISPTAKPPVCKLMDYGKYKYEQSKKRDEAKKKQKQVQIKEIKFRPGTDEGDYQIKMRNVTRFLADGDKVKITLRFRGREMAHQHLGAQLLERVKADLAEVAAVEQFPKMEGRQMVMMVAPKKK